MKLYLACKTATFRGAPGRIRTCDPRIRSPQTYVLACPSVSIWGWGLTISALLLYLLPSEFPRTAYAGSPLSELSENGICRKLQGRPRDNVPVPTRTNYPCTEPLSRGIIQPREAFT